MTPNRRSFFRRLGRLLASYPVGVALARLVGDSVSELVRSAPEVAATPDPTPVLPPGRTTTLTITWANNEAGRQWAEDLRDWLSAGMPVMGMQVGGEGHPARGCYWEHDPEPRR